MSPTFDALLGNHAFPISKALQRLQRTLGLAESVETDQTGLPVRVENGRDRWLIDLQRDHDAVVQDSASDGVGIAPAAPALGVEQLEIQCMQARRAVSPTSGSSGRGNVTGGPAIRLCGVSDCSRGTLMCKWRRLEMPVALADATQR